MNVPSSGCQSLVAQVTRMNATQIAAQVRNPSFGTTGQSQSLNVGPQSLPYDSAAQQMATPPTEPIQLTYNIINATAPPSGSNTVAGIASIAGNCQNPSGKNDAQTPYHLSLMINTVTKMVAYTKVRS